MLNFMNIGVRICGQRWVLTSLNLNLQVITLKIEKIVMQCISTNLRLLEKLTFMHLSLE